MFAERFLRYLVIFIVITVTTFIIIFIFRPKSPEKLPRIKNQQNCGSCTAFAVNGTIEELYHWRTKKVITLSEQEHLNCSGVLDMCSTGSTIINQINYVEKNGIGYEKDTPYIAKVGKCVESLPRAPIKITNVTKVEGEEDLLEALIKYKALPVSLNVDETFFKYDGGILDPDPPENAGKSGHAMVLVDHGVENGVNYWRLKNSWGPKWGEDGFVRIVRGKNAFDIGKREAYSFEI